jgi:hypothetical protein
LEFIHFWKKNRRLRRLGRLTCRQPLSVSVVAERPGLGYGVRQRSCRFQRASLLAAELLSIVCEQAREGPQDGENGLVADLATSSTLNLTRSCWHRLFAGINRRFRAVTICPEGAHCE